MGPRSAEHESAASAQPEDAPKNRHCEASYSPADVVRTQTFQTSIFQPREEFKERRCERSYTSSAVGRAGAFQEAVRIAPEGHTREVLFKRMVADALEKERLEGLYEAWAMWNSRERREVPMDNRELAGLRRQAAGIARRRLAAALGSGSGAGVGEALEAADAIAKFFPYALQATSSLEYAAALKHREERRRGEEQADGADDE